MPLSALWLTLLLFLPLQAFADGKVFAPEAFRETVNIPDQRALICWSNGTERLVIETRFQGAGSNFAWVVPVPSKPVIEAASTGLFPTLEYLFQPELIHKVPRNYLGVLFFLGMGCLLWRVKPGQPVDASSALAFLVVCGSCIVFDFMVGIWLTMVIGTALVLVRTQRQPVYTILALGFLGLMLSAFMLPALSRASASPVGISQAVRVLDRTRVGIYETTTISGADPSALGQWLSENGFSMSSNALPVIADYVKRGWVFVTARITREASTNQVSTIHPLSLTFQAETPVYPMTLTGVDARDSLSVDLYVFGPSRASAEKFVTKRCARPDFPPDPEAWVNRQPKSLEIHHPALKQWTHSMETATWLQAKLTPADMMKDIQIGWGRFADIEPREYSHIGAVHLAANYASGVLLAGSLAWFALRRKVASLRIGREGWLMIALVPATGLLVYSSLVKVPVRLQRSFPSDVKHRLQTLANWAAPANATVEELRKDLQDVRREFRDQRRNLITGQTIHEEDSPGNYSIRETEQSIEIIGYDHAAAPRVLRSIPK